MTGEELYDEYRANLQQNGAIIKCWDDISHIEKAAWWKTAADMTNNIRINQFADTRNVGRNR